MATSKLSSFIQSRFLKMINNLDISVMTAPLIVKIDIKFGHSLPHCLQWHRYCCLCAAVWQIYIQPFQSSLSLIYPGCFSPLPTSSIMSLSIWMSMVIVSTPRPTTTEARVVHGCNWSSCYWRPNIGGLADLGGKNHTLLKSIKIPPLTTSEVCLRYCVGSVCRRALQLPKRVQARGQR